MTQRSRTPSRFPAAAAPASASAPQSMLLPLALPWPLCIPRPASAPPKPWLQRLPLLHSGCHEARKRTGGKAVAKGSSTVAPGSTPPPPHDLADLLSVAAFDRMVAYQY